jgi:hypothetical protein
MPRRTKERSSSGRATPKAGGRATPPASNRYTPPIPKEYKRSPVWVPVLMFTLMGLGVIAILCNYLGLLPGGADNVYLIIGLGLITAGFLTATRYH